jgi:hypothetical protein
VFYGDPRNLQKLAYLAGISQLSPIAEQVRKGPDLLRPYFFDSTGPDRVTGQKRRDEA